MVVGLSQHQRFVLRSVDLDADEVVVKLAVEVPGAAGPLHGSLPPRGREVVAPAKSEPLALREGVNATIRVVDGFRQQAPTADLDAPSQRQAQLRRPYASLLDGRDDQQSRTLVARGSRSRGDHRRRKALPRRLARGMNVAGQPGLRYPDAHQRMLEISGTRAMWHESVDDVRLEALEPFRSRRAQTHQRRAPSAV